MFLLKIFLNLYLFFAIVLTQFSSAYFFSKARTNYRKVFSALTLCIGIYLFGFLMIINSSNLQEMVYWNQFQYLGVPFISVLWLVVALFYTKTIYSLKNRLIILLFSVPIATVFIRLTNPLHHLFYKSLEMRQIYEYSALYMVRGPWYYVNISYTALCLFLAILIYHLEHIKNRAKHTGPQFMVFILASLLPLIGVSLILSTCKEQGIDYVALTMPVSLIIINYGILKYDFLEIKTLARETIFENNTAAMIILEPGLGIIDYNKAALNFFKVLNISLDEYPIWHIPYQESELPKFFKDESIRDFSLIIDGKEHFFEIDSVLLNDPPGKNTRILKSIRDITKEKRMQKKLKVLATIDSLSGLYNRAEFMELAQDEFIGSKRNNKELSLLMIDIDHFKIVNDTFGHAAGDEVIRKLGNIIRDNFRKTDIVGRLGGDEFAVLLKSASIEEAEKSAKKLLKTIGETEIVYEEEKINITISIGAATTSGTANNDIENVLKLADAALYEAKTEGRNRIIISE